ncbi:MAG: hypothetical protein KKD27_02270, partial [Gammaproteobacteria bacterium]|nr:hypothetical protein [Gammaproteobacteria bacterium]MBU2281394.1 hypothetical protein [Gammaproteobacteria bacterium]MBU2372632.1 hypothetical protein [Gammaproteobacteria bacterium]
GFHRNVIDARGEDLLDVLFEHRELSWRALRGRRVYSAKNAATTGNPRTKQPYSLAGKTR